MVNFIDKKEILNELSYLKKCRDILKQKFDFSVARPKFFLHSFGCQGNLSESEKIKGMLLKIGYAEVHDYKCADFVLFNTCAVRESAQNRVFGNLGMVIHHKKRYKKDMIISVCGCMVQQWHVEKKIKMIFPEVDLIFGTHVLYKFARMIFEVLKNKKSVSCISDSDGVIAEGLPIARFSNVKAFVPISYGCDNFCSYCIVPYVKGRERSRKFEEVVLEVEKLIASGYCEVTLLGQNVNSYGFGFSNLLMTLNKIPGKFRIRFLTSHPKNLNKKLIDVIASCEKVCSHIHLPLQSGSDRILSLMNRGYSVRNYLEIVNYAKSKIKNVLFTTDIIVGFPGETNSDFEKTLELVKKVKFSLIYNFIYSKRRGTKAANMVDLTNKQEKVQRLRNLIEIQNKISEEILESFVGRVEEILFEGFVRGEQNLIYGRTNGNLIVRCRGEAAFLGRFFNVKIFDFCRTFLIGQIL